VKKDFACIGILVNRYLTVLSYHTESRVILYGGSMKKSIVGASFVLSALVAENIVNLAPVNVIATGVDETSLALPLSVAIKDENEIKLV